MCSVELQHVRKPSQTQHFDLPRKRSGLLLANSGLVEHLARFPSPSSLSKGRRPLSCRASSVAPSVLTTGSVGVRRHKRQEKPRASLLLLPVFPTEPGVRPTCSMAASAAAGTQEQNCFCRLSQQMQEAGSFKGSFRARAAAGGSSYWESCWHDLHVGISVESPPPTK